MILLSKFVTQCLVEIWAAIVLMALSYIHRFYYVKVCWKISFGKVCFMHFISIFQVRNYWTDPVQFSTSSRTGPSVQNHFKLHFFLEICFQTNPNRKFDDACSHWLPKIYHNFVQTSMFESTSVHLLMFCLIFHFLNSWFSNYKNSWTFP